MRLASADIITKTVTSSQTHARDLLGGYIVPHDREYGANEIMQKHAVFSS